MVFYYHITYIQLPRISAFNTNFRPVVDGVVLPVHPREILSNLAGAGTHSSPLHVRALMTGYVGSETSTVHTLFLHDLPRMYHFSYQGLLVILHLYITL